MNRASGQYSKFEQILLQYINVVAPIIQSLWSLEAAHANAADVFVFWLACTATLNDLFLKGTNVTGMSLSLANSITTIFNKCYQEFFTNEVYFTAFALDPHKFGAIVFITFNSQPVIVQGIHFPTYSKSPHQMHQQSSSHQQITETVKGLWCTLYTLIPIAKSRLFSKTCFTKNLNCSQRIPTSLLSRISHMCKLMMIWGHSWKHIGGTNGHSISKWKTMILLHGGNPSSFILVCKFLLFMFNSPIFCISLSNFGYLAFWYQNIFSSCQLNVQWVHKFNYHMVQLPNLWKPEHTDFNWYDTDWPMVWEASGMCTGSLDTTLWSWWLIPFRPMIQA